MKAKLSKSDPYPNSLKNVYIKNAYGTLCIPSFGKKVKEWTLLAWLIVTHLGA